MKKEHRFILAAACVLFCSSAVVPAQAQQNSCLGHEAADVRFETRTFPAQRIGDAVLFNAGMYVDADGAPNAYGPHNRGLDFTANAVRDGRFLSVATHPDGKPVIQRSGRFKGFYVSTTSLHNAAGSPTAPATYVDARKIPYIVLPPEFMKQFGVSLGDLAVVTNRRNGKSSFAIFADVGPHGKIGEGSVALARALGLKSDPRYGGTGNSSIAYLVFPKSGLGPGKLRSAKEIKTSALRAFRRWGGPKRLRACSIVS
ncbi:MAG TPA: glycoside hydrolase family 75 protein [Candidatus Angelobacter sp.]|nr:glycoside hydrolase family 75 protein [Candidatus Angelobacter sp.]